MWVKTTLGMVTVAIGYVLIGERMLYPKSQRHATVGFMSSLDVPAAAKRKRPPWTSATWETAYRSLGTLAVASLALFLHRNCLVR